MRLTLLKFLVPLALLLPFVGAQTIIVPPEGLQYLYLSTGPEANGGGTTGVDANGDGFFEADIASVSIAFDAGPGGGLLEFAFNVLTSEVGGGVEDLVIFGLDGGPIFEGGIDTPFDTVMFTPIGPFAGPPLLGPDGSIFFDGELGFGVFSIAVGPGVHVLDLQVLDDEDEVVDTALIIDALSLDAVVFEGFEGDTIGLPPAGPGIVEVIGNVTVQGETSFAVLPTPKPSTVALLGLGLLGLGIFARRRR